MSYDIYLQCPCCHSTVQVENHKEGGTYSLYGTTDAHLNMTYNYAEFIYPALEIPDGARFGEWLTGQTGQALIPALTKAVETLGTAQDKDYWKPTPGNAGYALSVLLDWCRQHPEAIAESD